MATPPARITILTPLTTTAPMALKPITAMAMPPGSRAKSLLALGICPRTKTGRHRDPLVLVRVLVLGFRLGFSAFGFLSDFGLRISDFRLSRPALFPSPFRPGRSV